MSSLSKLFRIENGVLASTLHLSKSPDSERTIPVLRPSQSFRKVIAGFAASDQVPSTKLYPANSLVVSTNGEGSHTYSYVIPYPFVPNSDVSVLIPLCEMTLEVKLFYATAITQSRWRYSYGRKPKGDRLASLPLPALPKWISSIEAKRIQYSFSGLEMIQDAKTSVRPGRLRRIDELFTTGYGDSLELNRQKPDPSGIAFVSRTARNNGISGRVARMADEPTPAGCLTVALGGTNVLATFLQSEPTYQGRDVAILTPKNPMSVTEKLWYAAAIPQHRFRFGFGRQANRQLPELTGPECPKSLAEAKA